MREIVLASASPRRSELLARIGLRFTVDASECEETVDCLLKPGAMVESLSLRKARAVASRHPGAIVIAADTIGVRGSRIIGKPHTEQEARAMLQDLNGRSHRVITGFTIIDTVDQHTVTRNAATTVHIRKLTPEEIENYVRSGEPLDKAGAYAIQGLGALIVEKINGDYYNVVGLPLNALMEALKEFGVHRL